MKNCFILFNKKENNISDNSIAIFKKNIKAKDINRQLIERG